MAVVSAYPLAAHALRALLERRGLATELLAAEPVNTLPARTAELIANVVLLEVDQRAWHQHGLASVIADLSNALPVVVITNSQDDAELGAMLASGAKAVASQRDSVDALIRMLRTAVRGGVELDSERRSRLLSRYRERRIDDAEVTERMASLTDAESIVLESLMMGRSAEAIAAERMVSIATVRSQIRAILTKLGVRTQLRAVALARRSGWLRDGDRSV